MMISSELILRLVTARATTTPLNSWTRVIMNINYWNHIESMAVVDGTQQIFPKNILSLFDFLNLRPALHYILLHLDCIHCIIHKYTIFISYNCVYQKAHDGQYNLLPHMVPGFSCCEWTRDPDPNSQCEVAFHAWDRPWTIEKLNPVVLKNMGKPWKGLGLGGVYIKNGDLIRKIVI